MFVAFAAMSVSLITFTSCSSNDNADEVLPAKEEVSNLLIGRWNLVGNYNSEGKEIDQQMPGESISFDIAGRMLKQWFNVKRSSYRWTVYEADGKLYLMVDVESYRIKKLNADEFEFYYSEADGKYSKLLLSAKVFTSLYELGLTLLTRYQPFLLPLSLLLN